MPKNPIQIDIDEDMQSLIVETAIQDYNNSKQSRGKIDYGRTDKGETISFDKRLDMIKDNWYGRRKAKTVPWRFCSNRSMKIGTAILEMMHARLFSAIWNEDLIRWKPGDHTDKDKVDRISKFMFWWVKVRNKMRDFFDGWVKTVAAYGDATIEASWDIKYRDKGEVDEQPITDELGMQLYEQDGTPSVSRQKKLAIEEHTKVEIIPKENVYLQENQKSLDEEPVIFKTRFFYSDLEQMEAEGKAVNIQNLLKTDILTRVTNEFSGHDDKTAAIMAEDKLNNTPVDVLKQYMKIDIDRDGFAEDVRVLIDPERRIYLGGVLVRDITKSGKRPLSCTKYNDYIDRMDELDGVGIIEQVLPLSDEIDAIFNQISDSNTLSVLRPGFYDPSGNLEPAAITIGPNKLIPVSDPQRNVFFPDFQIATERLIVAIRLVMEFIERLTGASSYVMGKESEIVGGSGTATRTQAIIANAEQRFSLPQHRLKAGAARILTVVLDLVQKNLPPGLETRVLGEDGEPIFEENELTQDGLSGEFDAYILGDPSQGSKQVEREIAALFYQVLMQNPLVGTDPMKIYKLTAQMIKAYDKQPEEFLGPEPEGADFLKPEDENTHMIQGDFAKVRAKLTENHIYHIQTHQLLEQSPSLLTMDPQMAQQILQFAQSHIQEHMMQLQQMMALSAQMGGQNANNAGGTSSNQGNAQPQGVESMSGPVGEVARRQREGQSSFSPTG